MYLNSISSDTDSNDWRDPKNASQRIEALAIIIWTVETAGLQCDWVYEIVAAGMEYGGNMSPCTDRSTPPVCISNSLC